MPDYSQYAKHDADDDEAYRIRPPKIFLVVAAGFVLVALGSYLAQDWLFERTRSDVSFLYILVFAIICAIASLFCYRFPRVGLRILGREADLISRNTDNIPGETHVGGGLTWNAFRSETGTEVKAQATRRKRARHMRRQTARATAALKKPDVPDNE